MNLVVLDLDWKRTPPFWRWDGDRDGSYRAHQALKELAEPLRIKPFVMLPGDRIAGVTEYGEAAVTECLRVRDAGVLKGVVAGVSVRPIELPLHGTFVCRASTITRTRNPSGRRISLDAFLHARQTDPHAVREIVYRKWFAERCARMGVDVENVRIIQRYLAIGARRTQAENVSGRRSSAVHVPVAVFTGEYKGDPTQVVRQGVGRHRSFGYGLFLVKGEME